MMATVRALEGYIQARRTGWISHPQLFSFAAGRQQEYIVKPTGIWKSSTHINASYILYHNLLFLTVDRSYYILLFFWGGNLHSSSQFISIKSSSQATFSDDMRKLWPLNPHLCSASGGTRVFVRPFSHIWTQQHCAL